jgi:hypothetical protein
MEYLRSRPKGDFIDNGSLQELYILTEHWQSELLFYKDDLKFLRHLEDKYFSWTTAQVNLENIRRVGESILKDTRDCDDLLQSIKKHLSYLAQIIDNDENQDLKMFRSEHKELEEDIVQFIANTKNNRRQLFKVIEFDVTADKF